MRDKRSVVQVISILVVFSFVFSSCSKSKKSSSNLKFAKVESALSMITLDGLEFEETKKNDGYKYEAKDPSSYFDIAYSAIADSKKNLSSITITNNDVDTSYLTNTKTFKKLMNESDFSLVELRAAMCATEVMQLMDLFGSDKTKKDEVIDELTALFQGEKITIEKWTIEADVDKSGERVVIKAYYD